MKTIVKACVLGGFIGLVGCAHRYTVAFQDLSYPVATKKYDAGVVAVIDRSTLSNTIQIQSFMAGVGNKWEAQPGEMLKQVADVELPQMFKYYRFSTDYQVADQGRRRITLYMTVPSYAFQDFHATITVHVIAYNRHKAVLFDKTYTESGFRQGAKMYWAGAFGMKSAMRQSSLDAYKKVFADMRADLRKVLDSGQS